MPSTNKVFIDRNYYDLESRTPRKCAACLAPASDRVRRSNQSGKPDNSSARPVCKGCSPAAQE